LPQEWTKAQIINHLARVHNYSRYLELCAATTGFRYGEIDRTRLTTARRLMYCAAVRDHVDGLGVDYWSTSRDIASCLEAMRREGLRFDVILVDPRHEYATSLRDLEAAFRLIDAGGSLIVHDCLPPSAEMAAPEFVPGSWCGLTYQAYVDFVSSHRDLAFYTVDTDFGCGVIRKLPGPAAWQRLTTAVLGERMQEPRSPADLARAALLKRFSLARAKGDGGFSFFQEHKAALLNLLTVSAFLEREGGAASSTGEEMSG
jgi:hypothetical protein